MTPVLVDTSVLGRLATTSSAPLEAVDAPLELHRLKEVAHLTPQNLVEFRNAATRPKGVNGLGLTVAEAEAKSAVFESSMPLLPETPDIYPAWKSMVNALGSSASKFTTHGSLPSVTCIRSAAC